MPIPAPIAVRSFAVLRRTLYDGFDAISRHWLIRQIKYVHILAICSVFSQYCAYVRTFFERYHRTSLLLSSPLTILACIFSSIPILTPALPLARVVSERSMRFRSTIFVNFGVTHPPTRNDMGGSSILPCCPLRAESQSTFRQREKKQLRGRRSGILTLYQTCR